MNKGLMTNGTIWKKILVFSLPLLLGNLFQLLYNTVDSIVVGQYVGTAALASVGASTPLINLIIGFFIGLATGAGVIVARKFGARDFDGVSDAIHTFMTFSLIVGIVFTVFGYLCSPFLLELMGTPDDVLPLAIVYLQIYFLGAVFVVLYNAGTGVLQALGDSKHPLYFLGVSSVVNIVLDLVFVVNLKMGVAGVALGTLIAQAIACVLVIMTLLREDDKFKFEIRKLRINPYTLKEIIRIGIPAGIQTMIVSLSNVIVQAYINGFGAAAVAGFSSANKFDNFLGLPINSFALAITTFAAQNIGAKQYDRVKKGVRTTLIMTIAIVVGVGMITFVFAEQCISIFSNDPDVIANGALIMRIMIPFYFTLCFHQVYSGALRAGGLTKIPMYTSIFAFVIVRQIYLSIVMAVNRDISILAWGYSLTWVIAAVTTGIYYHHSHWIEKEIEKNKVNEIMSH